MEITLSSHVLDLDAGRPASGMKLRLTNAEGDVLVEGITDEDGRLPAQTLNLEADVALSLSFETGAWYREQDAICFYPHVHVAFHPVDPGHYHIPLLINRHGYSTYRGS